MQSPLISFERDRNMGNFLVRSAFLTSELLKVHAQDVKHLSFATLRKYRDPSDPSRSLIMVTELSGVQFGLKSYA